MPDVADNTARSRYEMDVDGNIAFVVYRWQNEIIVLEHTEVPQALAGRGIGSKLARAVLEDIARRGLHIKAECEFIAAFIDRNPNFSSLIAT